MSQALDPVLRVALDVPLPRLFDYLGGAGAVPGSLVRVPFGKTSKTGVVVAVAAHSEQPAAKLKAIEAVLDVPPLPADWLALCEFVSRYYQHPLGGVTGMALPPLLRQGKLPRVKKSAAVSPAPTFSLPVLLEEQATAVAAITGAHGFAPFLLHGITGSGKTEVYLRAIAAVLERGGQAMMLVPEIALTPQLEGRVAARFPRARIAIAHSGVADAGRTRGFLDAHAGRADIVLGTRLAVFMPLPRLQLIVIDEEHDGSFKQQDGLRYSARDVAVFRAKQRQVPIVLGSATPSLETFHHAQPGLPSRGGGSGSPRSGSGPLNGSALGRPGGGTGRYRLLELTRRAVAEAPPTVRVVDTRREKLQDGMSVALIKAMSERLQRNEQSLIFLNRRGYAPVLACPACGWISGCRRCAANLVVHLADQRLRCHHCGLEAGIPRACPDCGNADIHPFGRGTQRLEATINERFPEARVLRIDRDSASTPTKWAALLDAIHAGEADILVGTQMLAKGHDFPKLTLVGVVGADAALFAADFRAPERLFAQLMQVGGRSGRAELAGEVLIQTEYPSHPLYQALIAHDYAAFAAAQLDEREQAGFPPYVFQALLRAEAGQLDAALTFLGAARDAAVLLGGGITLYDPVPMRLFRKMTLERGQLLVESASRPALQAFLAAWSARLYQLKTPRDLRWHLDVDPLEF
ncbi:MAG: primosomal protein N' [Sulfurisoma sp.]|nr:primosomal protein N' [Sulfurisoma sp.]